MRVTLALTTTAAPLSGSCRGLRRGKTAPTGETELRFRMPRRTRLERNDLPSQWPPDLIPVTDKGKKISRVFFGRASQQIYVGQTPAHSPGWKRTVQVLESRKAEVRAKKSWCFELSKISIWPFSGASYRSFTVAARKRLAPGIKCLRSGGGRLRGRLHGRICRKGGSGRGLIPRPGGSVRAYPWLACCGRRAAGGR
jgi:hypothetical protein